MLNQRLHNGVVTLVQHLNNKRPKNTSSWEADQIDLTTILIVSEEDKNPTKVFNLLQRPPFSAYDMASRVFFNLNTMKTIMVFKYICRCPMLIAIFHIQSMLLSHFVADV